LPTHIHLIGYDTLTRFLAPKYYPKYSPPLSALEPFFGFGHKVLVLLRPDSSSDNAVSGDTEEEQRAYINGLSEGSLEDQGLKKDWAEQIGLLEGGDVASAAGISSTVIRRGVKKSDWGDVERMCTPAVAAWIRDQRLYEDDENGAKMA
jgi:nicotinamide-nucleotide adenylyltransferase